jgi:hypothetical protein
MVCLGRAEPTGVFRFPGRDGSWRRCLTLAFLLPAVTALAPGPIGAQQQGARDPAEGLAIATDSVEHDEPPQFFRLPAERHRGCGEPLIQESWNYRPFSVGGFVGFIQGGTLIDDWASEGAGVLGGIRLGWDFHCYWGCETRLAVGNPEVCDSWRARQAQQAADDAAGLDPDDPYRRRFEGRRNNDLLLWDVRFLHYPWGDTRTRPYFAVGMGAASFKFTDRLSTTWEDTVFDMPLAVGVKYLVKDYLAFRLEFADEIMFAGGKTVDTVHHFTVTLGAEFRFGGTRRAYWPWNPGGYYGWP